MQTYAMHISYATAYSNAWFLIQFQSEINKAVGIIFATIGLISEPVGMISIYFGDKLYFLVYLQWKAISDNLDK